MSKKAAILLAVLIVVAIAIFGAGPFVLFGPAPDGWIQNASNFGQFVSGIFAPLAFVGLLIAVFLQSKELELQRLELRDTREVLELQKEEMKRAADENRERTRIMTENLRSEAERQAYSEADIILYSLALYIRSQFGQTYIRVGTGGRHLIDASNLGEISKENSDKTYTFLLHSVTANANQLQKQQLQSYSFSDEGRQFLRYVSDTLWKLANEERYAQNQLVKARINGLQIPKIVDALKFIRQSVGAG